MRSQSSSYTIATKTDMGKIGGRATPPESLLPTVEKLLVADLMIGT